MLYRHTPLFQLLLQQATELARRAEKLSDTEIIKQAKLDCSKSTLYRFRTAQLIEANDGLRHSWALQQLDSRYLNGTDARRLWDWLSKRGYIERAVNSQDGFSKKSLYTSRELANVLMAFYGCNERQTAEWIKGGIEGEWYCYKPSFRKLGFIVKSLVDIKAYEEEYLEIIENQRSSGIFEVDGEEVSEISSGIGFSKSHKLWFIMREEAHDQPRIFSFISKHSIKTGQLILQRDEVTILTGRVMESDQKWSDVSKLGLYYYYVVLVKKDTDRKIYSKYNQEYDHYDQVELIPFRKEQVDLYGSRKNCFIPPEIRDALENGRLID